MIDKVELAKRIRDELYRQGREGISWTQSCHADPSFFGLDGDFDLEAVAEVCIKAITYEAAEEANAPL